MTQARTIVGTNEILPEFDFSRLSEADIREEIIAPVLRALGYRSGTVNTVIREKAIVSPVNTCWTEMAR